MLEDNIFFRILVHILAACVLLPLIYLVIRMFVEALTAPFRKDSSSGIMSPSIFWMWFITHNKY